MGKKEEEGGEEGEVGGDGGEREGRWKREECERIYL